MRTLKFVSKEMCVQLCVPHGLCVGIVGTEVQGHGADDSQLRGHLLHPPKPSLLLRICKLNHQAGRGTLWRRRRESQLSQLFTTQLAVSGGHHSVRLKQVRNTF